MSNYFLRIDVDKSKYKNKKDLVKVRFKNNDFVQFHFNKLFI